MSDSADFVRGAGMSPSQDDPFTSFVRIAGSGQDVEGFLPGYPVNILIAQLRSGRISADELSFTAQGTRTFIKPESIVSIFSEGTWRSINDIMNSPKEGEDT